MDDVGLYTRSVYMRGGFIREVGLCMRLVYA